MSAHQHGTVGGHGVEHEQDSHTRHRRAAHVLAQPTPQKACLNPALRASATISDLRETKNCMWLPLMMMSLGPQTPRSAPTPGIPTEHRLTTPKHRLFPRRAPILAAVAAWETLLPPMDCHLRVWCLSSHPLCTGPCLVACVSFAEALSSNDDDVFYCSFRNKN